MTVQEIFALRKQGRVEEAYEAIRPMYAVHKGYYTSLCMYLTARDVLLLRLDQGRTIEAQKIYEALKRLIPSIEDKDGQVARFMEYAGRRLDEAESEESRSLHKVEMTKEDVIPSHECHVEHSRDISEISPCATLSRDDKQCPPIVIPSEVEESLNKGQQAVLDCIKANPGLRVPMISEGINIPSKSIERHISVLISRNLIEHRGSKKTGGYYAK